MFIFVGALRTAERVRACYVLFHRVLQKSTVFTLSERQLKFLYMLPFKNTVGVLPVNQN